MELEAELVELVQARELVAWVGGRMPSRRFKRKPAVEIHPVASTTFPVAAEPEPEAESPSRKRARQGQGGGALGPENVGFRMLAKLGYQVGQGLGKDERGRLDPIEVHPPKRKAGLGHEREVERQAAEEVRQHRVQEQARQAGFQQSVRSRLGERRIGKLVRQARATIRHLDERASVSCHELWPHEPTAPAGGAPLQAFEAPSGEMYARSADAAEDADPVPPTAESLRACIAYLLSAHSFSMSQAGAVEIAETEPSDSRVEEELATLLDEDEL